MNRHYSGVSNVAYYLPRALAKNVFVTYFPARIIQTSYALNLLNVYRRLAIRDFDVVHFNVIPDWAEGGYSLFSFAKIIRAPTVLNIHGILQLENTMYGTIPCLNKALLKTVRCCKMANKIVTYSEFMRNRIITWYRVNGEKIAVIPNGVDIKKFSECKSELFLEGDPAILYLGHLSKSPNLLINAISIIRSELPELKLHVVGGRAHSLDALKLLAIKKGVENRVIFHGGVAPEKTPSYYKAADFFIFPSQHTPAGITILEAMASGTAVIASNSGGTPEIITHGKDGVLFEPGNTKALANAIMKLHQDQELKKTISREALKTVTKYSWENIAKKYVSLYQDLRKSRSYTTL